MKFEVSKILNETAVLIALIGWSIVAGLLIIFPSMLVAADTGTARWPKVITMVFWALVFLLVACCVVSLGKALANLVSGRDLLPNVVAVVMSAPLFVLLAVFWRDAFS